MSEDTQRNPKPVTTEERLARLNRALPFSEEAEKGVLSCFLQDPERLSDVRSSLPPEAFYHPSRRTIYERMLEMTDRNVLVEPVALTQVLRERGELDLIGGAGEIMELYGFVPVASQWTFYLKQVKDKFAVRRTIHACAESIDELHEHGAEQVNEDVTEVIGRAEGRVFECVQALQASGEYSTGPVLARQGVLNWLDHMTRVIDNRGKILGLATGIHELDQTVHGVDDTLGEIIVIAARPGQGKTAMVTTLIHNMSVDQQVPGLMFSAEMTSEQIYTRIILGGACIDTSKAITGMFSGTDQRDMTSMAHRVQTAPLLISDGSHITTADIRSQVQVAKRQHGIRYIVVDHLHLIKAVSQRGRKDEREALVEVMETLQFVKKQYKLAVFLLVQLNRETDRNAGKPPVLADLSGSAAIEWYADHVWMLHRDPYFVPWHSLSEEKQKAWTELVARRRRRSPELWSDGQKYSEEDGGFARQDYEEDAKVYVRKNRRGPTPELHIRFQDWRTWFSTRMPRLNSTDPDDWQIGTYAVPKKKKPEDRIKTLKGSKMTRLSSLDEDFPD